MRFISQTESSCTVGQLIMVPVNNGKMADLIALLPEHWSMSMSASFFADGGGRRDKRMYSCRRYHCTDAIHHHTIIIISRRVVFLWEQVHRDPYPVNCETFSQVPLLLAVKEDFPVHNKSLALFILNPTISIWLNSFDHQPLHLVVVVLRGQQEAGNAEKNGPRPLPVHYIQLFAELSD